MKVVSIDDLLGWGPGNATFAMIKPDAHPVRTDMILDMIAEAGLEVVAKREMRMDAKDAAIFYYEHIGRSHYQANVDLVTSGLVLALAVIGHDAVTKWRGILGATNSALAEPRTICGMWGNKECVRENCAHGSDGPISALRELLLVFSETGKPLVGADPK